MYSICMHDRFTNMFSMLDSQSTLLIFPGSTVHASSQGLVRKVIVGDTAQPEILQLLSLSNNITEFQIAKNLTVHEHSQTVERDIMELSESQGALTYSGDIRTIELDFFPAPTLLTGLFTQELVVSNMLDGSQQKILVSMMVCLSFMHILHNRKHHTQAKTSKC